MVGDVTLNAIAYPSSGLLRGRTHNRGSLLLVGILVATMTFEDFFLKWLPVSDFVYSVSRMATEVTIYALFVYVIGKRLASGARLKPTPIDFAIVSFLLVAGVSVIVNDAPWLASFINLRVLVRYVAVFYIVVNLDLRQHEVRLLLGMIVVVGCLQSALGLLQALQGQVGTFWLPRASALEVAGYSKNFTVLSGGIEKGAVTGAFGHSVAMGMYLTIAIVIALAFLLESDRRRVLFRIACLGAVLIMAAGIAVTYSRSALAALVLAIPVILWHAGRYGLVVRALIAGLALLAIVLGTFAAVGGPKGVGFVKVRETYVSPLANVGMLFSAEYWERTEGSRQWVIKEVGTSLLRQASLVGFSPDENTAKSAIIDRANGTLSKLVTYKAFEDVYWVALLAYYGLIGLSLYLYMMWKLYRESVRGHRAILETSRIATLAFSTLLIVTIPLTMIVRTFEFRVFGFYFWLLAALMFSETLRNRRRRAACLRTEPETGAAALSLQ